MPSSWHSSRIDTLEIKVRITKKLGNQKAEKYFHYLGRFLNMKLSKSEFDKLCIGTIGKENVALHNHFLGSIIKNAYLAKTPPLKGSKMEGSVESKVSNGYQVSNFQSVHGDVLPPSPRKGRSSNIRDRKFKDRPSPLGPHGKTQSVTLDESLPKTQEQQSATELFSLGSRPLGEVISVEDGEEVEQIRDSPSVQSRSPVRAPLGIPMNMGGARKALRGSSLMDFHFETCSTSYELPDTRLLRKRLERRLETEGLGISMESVNLLNNGLDAFLKRLIKPCLELGGSRHANAQPKLVRGQLMHNLMQRSTRAIPASLLDFRVAMELNPQLLGEDWPLQLEKVCLHASEE